MTNNKHWCCYVRNKYNEYKPYCSYYGDRSAKELVDTYNVYSEFICKGYFISDYVMFWNLLIGSIIVYYL